MSKVYTDVFNIQHTDCTVVDTINEFSRIFIIQDKNGSRFTCLKDDAKPAKKEAVTGRAQVRKMRRKTMPCRIGHENGNVKNYHSKNNDLVTAC
nr:MULTISPECIES: hypothetical protein [Lactiplantibacillus]